MPARLTAHPAQYIHTQLEQLAQIARAEKLDVLAYLLEVAALEADAQMRDGKSK